MTEIKAQFTPLSSYEEYSPEEMQARVTAFYEKVRCRTLRAFSDRPVPREINERRHFILVIGYPTVTGL